MNDRSKLKTRLQQIANELIEKNGHYTSADVWEIFQSSISTLPQAEQFEILKTGTNVIIGQLSSSKANLQSPYIAGLGLNNSVKLKLADLDGRVKWRSYRTDRITPEMFHEHQRNIDRSASGKKASSKPKSTPQLDLLAQAIEEMERNGAGPRTSIGEFRDQ